jgi:hypothetical protein
LLTEAAIKETVEREYCRAFALFPTWEHPFSAFGFSRARRAFGQAHQDGRLLLSRSFIGTDAVDDLQDTIRHELAHLIAGIRFKHGPRWQQVDVTLGACPRASGRSSNSDLHARMTDAPFTLIAVMSTGEERTLRRVFRRARRYIDYRLGHKGQQYHIHGELIQRFRYLDHRK